jgi:hypothetical protein
MYYYHYQYHYHYYVLQGQWVLLHNAHHCPHLLNAIESLMAENAPANMSSDQTFRLWITTKATPDTLPVRLLQNAARTVVSSPKVKQCQNSEKRGFCAGF